MSSINPNRYPLDYSGTALTNKVAGERITLNPRKIRCFAPLNAPFFKKNIVIHDVDSGQPLTGTQFRCFNLVSAPTAIAGIGNDVYAMVIITDQSVSNNLEVDYQTVGGDYVFGYDVINTMLQALTQDNRPVTWDNLLDRDTVFNPNQHLHPVEDTLGWEYLIAALEQLSMAILLGDDVKKDFILQYIDTALASSDASANAAVSPTSPFGLHVDDENNPHGVNATQLGLANVQNFAIATLAEVYAGIVTNKYVTVDQIGMAIQNAVNLGMDAHIIDHTNPHQVTKLQLALDQVQNLAIATLEQMTNPDPNTPLYVTNIVLGQWLTAYFATQTTANAATVATITANITAALQAATTAQEAAATAQQQAQTATAQNQAAVTAAAAALTQAQANAESITGANTAAQALIQQYVTAAVAAAETAAYNRGYAAGLAGHS